MKKYYSKIHSSFIFRLIRIYCGLIEEEIEETLKNFDNELEMSKYKYTYDKYQSNIKKLKAYREILDHEKETDFIIIND